MVRLTLAACLVIALALILPWSSAAAACPNEQVRQESNVNPEGHAYSTLLPDCRAYEMVSPLNKQGRDASVLGGFAGVAYPVAAAPGGERADWLSEGAFAEPENYQVTAGGNNLYVSRREPSGWTTSSAFLPREFVDVPFGHLGGDYSPDLSSHHGGCGTAVPKLSGGEPSTASFACAVRGEGGTWRSSRLYRTQNGEKINGNESYLGGSEDLSRLFVQPVEDGALQGEIGSARGLAGSSGIYEVAGIGTPSETLRLVNVDNAGEELTISEGETHFGPLLGDLRVSPLEVGWASHAISADGRAVFFIATLPPPAEPPENEILTLFARRQCIPGPESPNCTEDGNHEYFETVTISDDSACANLKCESPEKKPAYFQGASADGSKVFFMTEQKLLSKEPAPTNNLYEYDFTKPLGERLVLLSQPTKGEAKVQSALRVSADGSHVYFAAQGVLTGEANQDGETAKPAPNTNLYGYDTVTNKIRFIATASGGAASNWGLEATGGRNGEPRVIGPVEGNRAVQVTPDGRDLVFSSPAPLAHHKPEPGVSSVYRYDFETEELTWVSHSSPGFATPAGGERSALIASEPGQQFKAVGPNADVEDWSRAMSGLKVKEAGREYVDEHDGEYIVFTTAAQLAANDVNGARDVYEWYCPGNVNCRTNGTVHLISDGLDPLGVQSSDKEPAISISATGADIFFTTHTRLVGQDTDTLRDVYDARVEGGFPAPKEPPCTGEACQGTAKNAPKFEEPASTQFVLSRSLTPPIQAVSPGKEAKSPSPTAAEQLAAGLKACKTKARSKRAVCEAQARRRYRSQLLAKALTACTGKPKAKRASCEAQAKRRYRR